MYILCPIEKVLSTTLPYYIVQTFHLTYVDEGRLYIKMARNMMRINIKRMKMANETKWLLYGELHETDMK